MASKKFEPPQTPDEFFREVEAHRPTRGKSAHGEIWAVYARLSREEPGRYQYSKDTQINKAEAYARNHGAEQVLVYKDWDYSGKNSKRPEFQRLIRDIKAGRVDVVVVHRLDRLYRNLESLLHFIRLLKKCHVCLMSVTEAIDTDTWWGLSVLHMLGMLAEMWVRQTSERTNASLNRRARKGLPLGDLPLGYCNGLCSACTDPNGEGYCPLWGEPDRIESQGGRIPVPHPVDHYVVRWIVDSYHNGMSYHDIADYLNFHDFTLPDGTQVHFRTRGKKSDRKKPIEQQDRTFKRDSIRIIVGNIFYAGFVARYPSPDFSIEDNVEHPERIPTPKPKGNPREIVEKHPGQHKPLITLQLWEANQSIRKGRSNSPTNARRKTRIYPLTGVGRCWECKRQKRVESLRGTLDHGLVYYRCAYTQKSIKRRSTRRPSAATQALKTHAL
ncbi:MAG: recombinase family protein, partial [Gammaproteobacteria bacterium]